MQKSIIFLVGFELNNDTDLKKRKVTSHSSLKFYINNIEWNFSLTESAEIDKIILILKKLANFLLRFYLGCSLILIGERVKILVGLCKDINIS